MGFRGGKLAMADIAAVGKLAILRSSAFWQRRRYATGLSLRVGVVIGSRCSHVLVNFLAEARRWTPDWPGSTRRGGSIARGHELAGPSRGGGRLSYTPTTALGACTRRYCCTPTFAAWVVVRYATNSRPDRLTFTTGYIHSLDRARLATQPRPPHKDAATNSPCSARPASRRSPPPTAR